MCGSARFPSKLASQIWTQRTPTWVLVDKEVSMTKTGPTSALSCVGSSNHVMGVEHLFLVYFVQHRRKFLFMSAAIVKYQGRWILARRPSNLWSRCYNSCVSIYFRQTGLRIYGFHKVKKLSLNCGLNFIKDGQSTVMFVLFIFFTAHITHLMTVWCSRLTRMHLFNSTAKSSVNSNLLWKLIS